MSHPNTYNPMIFLAVDILRRKGSSSRLLCPLRMRNGFTWSVLGKLLHKFRVWSASTKIWVVILALSYHLIKVYFLFLHTCTWGHLDNIYQFHYSWRDELWIGVISPKGLTFMSMPTSMWPFGCLPSRMRMYMICLSGKVISPIIAKCLFTCQQNWSK